MPVPEVARHLVGSKCGARNSETYNPIWSRPDARVGGVGHYPDFIQALSTNEANATSGPGLKTIGGDNRGYSCRPRIALIRGCKGGEFPAVPTQTRNWGEGKHLCRHQHQIRIEGISFRRVRRKWLGGNRRQSLPRLTDGGRSWDSGTNPIKTRTMQESTRLGGSGRAGRRFSSGRLRRNRGFS